MWQELLTAFALLLVLEGIMPFVNPEGLKRMLSMVAQMGNRLLRLAGISSMLLGVIILYIIR